MVLLASAVFLEIERGKIGKSLNVIRRQKDLRKRRGRREIDRERDIDREKEIDRDRDRDSERKVKQGGHRADPHRDRF